MAYSHTPDFFHLNISQLPLAFVYLERPGVMLVGWQIICGVKARSQLLKCYINVIVMAICFSCSQCIISSHSVPKRKRVDSLYHANHCMGCNLCRWSRASNMVSGLPKFLAAHYIRKLTRTNNRNSR